MARGNDKHTSVDQFDISAFLNLMTNCNHFDFEGKNKVSTNTSTNASKYQYVSHQHKYKHKYSQATNTYFLL